jgi:phosphoesterase RecJ-like protein
MSEDSKNLKDYIENADKIFISTHNGADVDAITSCLLMVHACKKYFEKDVDFTFTSEFTHSSDKLEYGYLWELMKRRESNQDLDISDVDLVILTDVASLVRAFKENYEVDDNAKTISIDHHLIYDYEQEKLDLSINNRLSSAAEQVWTTIYEILGEDWLNDEYVAELTQLGILSDTNRFLYEVVKPSTYDVMAKITKVKLVPAEPVFMKLNSFPPTSMKVLVELIENTVIDEEMCYSTLSKEFIEENGLNTLDRNRASSMYLNDFMRSIDGVGWGFLIKESMNRKGEFKVSFRSTNLSRPVNDIAELFGGGGHKNAAGGVEFKDSSMEEVIKTILEGIRSLDIK